MSSARPAPPARMHARGSGVCYVPNLAGRQGTTGGGGVFTYQEPVASRTAQSIRPREDVNEWIYDIEAFLEEWDLLEANDLDSSMSYVDYVECLAQIDRLMDNAELGEVRFADRWSEGDVMRRAGCEFVIELRPLFDGQRPFGKAPGVHVRLYYAEPTLRPNGLLALKLAAKENSAAGLREQDHDIDEAADRAHAWQDTVEAGL